MTERPYGPFQTELSYTLRRIEQEYGIGYSEHAAELGRTVAHLQD